MFYGIGTPILFLPVIFIFDSTLAEQLIKISERSGAKKKESMGTKSLDCLSSDSTSCKSSIVFVVLCFRVLELGVTLSKY